VSIDAHLHLWNTERLRYEWLQRPENAAINRTFGFEDFRSLAVAAGVDRAVLVQADDSAADTEAMFEVAAAHPEIAGVVAWVPLDRPDEAAARLDQLQKRPGFAGIRTLIHDQPDPDWLLRPAVGEGLALLERRGIPFDVISVLPRHLSHVPVLSERYPALRMVLDHLSHPPLGGADTSEWRALITAAARNPLVFAKVSGLYPADPSWTAADLRDVVEFAVGLRAGRPGVHLGPVRPGLLPAARGRRRTGRVRPRHLRLPRRPPGRAPVAPPGGPEPGDDAVHPGRLRGSRAGADPDAGRSAQAQASGIVGVTVEVKNHVWGEHATEFLATGTAVRRLAEEHRLPETTPKPTFTLGLDA
jgi:L-fuconolactonase